MRPVLFGAALFAVLVCATAADAGILLAASTSHRTVTEALRRPPPAPRACADITGANDCYGVMVAEHAPDGLRWRYVWASGDSTIICVDRATADVQVDCETPDATPIPWEPGEQSRVPGHPWRRPAPPRD